MKKISRQKLLERCRQVHGNRYNYDKVEYYNMNTKIIITCPLHGDFKQLPSSHIIRKSNCPKCGKIRTAEYTKKDINEFILESTSIHNNKYNYDKVEYHNMNTKIIITCPLHGDFKQLPLNHLHSKSGCPKCSSSKGELQIHKILSDHKIKYIFQKTFEDCYNDRHLPFDFYLPELCICIEYDGEQHFKSIEHFGGNNAFLKIKKNDNIKTNFCDDNHIQLIRINFFDNIEEKILWYLKLNKGLYNE